MILATRVSVVVTMAGQPDGALLRVDRTVSVPSANLGDPEGQARLALAQLRREVEDALAEAERQADEFVATWKRIAVLDD